MTYLRANGVGIVTLPYAMRVDVDDWLTYEIRCATLRKQTEFMRTMRHHWPDAIIRTWKRTIRVDSEAKP